MVSWCYVVTMKTKQHNTKNLTIRLPLDLWKKLRNLQTEGKIKSIQRAVIDGLRKIIGVEKEGK